MKRSTIIKLLALAIFGLLASCASPIRPLASKPPAAKIRVNKPFDWGDGVIMIKVNMPAGDYLPKFEDDDGYYYEAPQKITGRDSFWPIMMDGGLYLEKSLTKPEKFYIIRNNYGIPAKLNIGDRADMTLIKK